MIVIFGLSPLAFVIVKLFDPIVNTMESLSPLEPVAAPDILLEKLLLLFIVTSPIESMRTFVVKCSVVDVSKLVVTGKVPVNVELPDAPVISVNVSPPLIVLVPL